MSLRSRSISSKQEPIIEKTTTSSTTSSDDESETPKPSPQPPQPLPPPSLSLSQRAISQTLASTANLANLLPTGTLLAFQLLTPVFTHNGTCDSATRPMTFILLSLLSLSCLIACFTDSFKSPQGQVYYGIATFKGMYLFDYPYNNDNTSSSSSSSSLPDLSKYKLSFIDWVHAVLSVFVFVAMALRDRNVVTCFYPQPGHEVQEVLDIVPVGIGLLCSLLFVVFPTTRHGIGFPVTTPTTK